MEFERATKNSKISFHSQNQICNSRSKNLIYSQESRLRTTSSENIMIVDLLSLADDYANDHAEGSSKLKKSMWNLTKARREKGGFHLGHAVPFSAVDVREELRARAVLDIPNNDDENKKISEHDDDELGDNDGGIFVLHLNGMPKKERQLDDDTSDSPYVVSDNFNAGAGLRQRKKENDNEKNVWIKENIVYLDPFEKEEQRLQNADPLDLFGGISPPALKAAQREARASLESYINAANNAVKILQASSAYEANCRK